MNLKQNLLVPKINNGDVPSVYPRNGCVMVILTVLMELMKMLQPMVVPIQNLVKLINTNAKIVVVSIKTGFVIMIMTVEMVPTSDVTAVSFLLVLSLLNFMTSSVSDYAFIFYISL